MKNFAIIDGNGDILYTISAPLGFYEDGKVLGEGQICYEYPSEITGEELIKNHYRKSGKWLKKPEQPSEFHVWSASDEKWKFAADIFKRNSNAYLEKLRNEKLLEPVNVAGHSIDVKGASVTNIDSKISEIQAKLKFNMEINEAQLFWRDANNESVKFDNADDYLNWLLLAKIIISEKRTQTYEWAWSHKKAIDELIAAEDVGGLKNYIYA